MLPYILSSFILGIISAYLGFGRLAGIFALISKILAVIFLVVFVGSLIKHLLL
ncbi:MAG: DUF1328 domain-containing protein [Alphaproteobacteria bacterium]|nr:DUF1328 domain-containing protein [Alphaproteobacteria bacterium]